MRNASNPRSSRALAGRFGPLLRSGPLICALYVAIAVTVTLKDGVIDTTHTTFKIYRQSFWHLLHGTNLYAHYPAEQGAHAVDLFKYSPSAAALFLPFALPPYAVAMLCWSLLNAFALWFALDRLLGTERARYAQWLLLPELYATTGAMQCNALIAALVIAGFVALERRHELRAALSIVVAAAFKIYPAGALAFALFHPRRPRFAAATAAASLLVLLLPLLFTTPALLLEQYRAWWAVGTSDEHDLLFGHSIMRVARELLQVSWPNWPVQLVATLVLLAPLLVRRDRWTDGGFRVTALASFLVFAVVFNHQAERASFVIGAAGAVIWYLTRPPNLPRTLLTLLAVAGLESVPLFLAWLVMQRDLWSAEGPVTQSRPPSAAAAPQSRDPTARGTRGSVPGAADRASLPARTGDT